MSELEITIFALVVYLVTVWIVGLYWQIKFLRRSKKVEAIVFRIPENESWTARLRTVLKVDDECRKYYQYIGMAMIGFILGIVGVGLTMIYVYTKLA